MEDLINWATDLVAEYGYLIIFLLAAADNLGLPSAGDIALLAGSAAAARDGELTWQLVVLVAFCGGLFADNLSYALGRYGGGPIVRRFVPNKFLTPIETRLHNNAGRTLISGRMIAGFRAGVPLVSGVSRMKYRTFFVYNFMGVVIWALLVGSAGYVFARSISTVATAFERGGKIVAVVILTTLFIVGIVSYVRSRTRKALDIGEGESGLPDDHIPGDPLDDDLRDLTVRKAAQTAMEARALRRHQRAEDRSRRSDD